ICPHRGGFLSEGELDGTTLECICHGSRFDVSTGDVLRGPAQQSVQVYAVRAQGDALVVDVPPAGCRRRGRRKPGVSRAVRFRLAILAAIRTRFPRRYPSAL